jgi:hypothetical protein
MRCVTGRKRLEISFQKNVLFIEYLKNRAPKRIFDRKVHVIERNEPVLIFFIAYL